MRDEIINPIRPLFDSCLIPGHTVIDNTRLQLLQQFGAPPSHYSPVASGRFSSIVGSISCAMPVPAIGPDRGTQLGGTW